MSEPNRCLFAMRQHGKPVPYWGCKRSDGENHGFKAIKNRPDLVDQIPEAADNETIKRALQRLSAPESGVFSIGCEKSFNATSGKFWVKGYIEFAINAVELAGEAQHYFKMFFEFNRHLWKSNFQLPVQFLWELEDNDFENARCRGFSVAVWITTGNYPTSDEARRTWEESVDVFSEFVSSFALPSHFTKIYP